MNLQSNTTAIRVSVPVRGSSLDSIDEDEELAERVLSERTEAMDTTAVVHRVSGWLTLALALSLVGVIVFGLLLLTPELTAGMAMVNLIALVLSLVIFLTTRQLEQEPEGAPEEPDAPEAAVISHNLRVADL